MPTLPLLFNKVLEALTRAIRKEKVISIVKVKLLSCVQLFVTLWTVACQALPSTGFSRQEYWSGLSFHSPGYLLDQGIEFGSLRNCRKTLYHLSHGETPQNCKGRSKTMFADDMILYTEKSQKLNQKSC